MFDVKAARSEGYSEQEIADYLAKDNSFDVQGAISEGYSYSEIVDELNTPSSSKAPKTPEADQFQDISKGMVEGALADTYDTQASPGFTERAGDALGRVIGDKQGSRSAATAGAAEGLTFGFADEAEAAYVAAQHALKGELGASSILDVYKARRDSNRNNIKRQRDQDPDAATVGEVSTAVVPLSVGAQAAKNTYKAADSLMRAKRMPAILAATKSGAKTGALAGLGYAEGDSVDQVKSTAKGATIGALLGAGLSGTGAVLGKIKDKSLKPKGDAQERLFSRVKNEFDYSPKLDIRDIDHAKTVVNNVKVKINSEVDTLIDNAVSAKGLPKNTSKTAKQLIKNKNNSLSEDAASELESLLGKEDFQGVKKLIDESNEMNSLFNHTGRIGEKGRYNATVLKTPGRYLYERALFRHGGNPVQNQVAQAYRGTKNSVPFGQEATQARELIKKKATKELAGKLKQQESRATNDRLTQQILKSNTSSLPKGGWKGAAIKSVDVDLRPSVDRKMLDKAIENVKKALTPDIKDEVIRLVESGKPPAGFMYNVTDELAALAKRKQKPRVRVRSGEALKKYQTSLQDAKGNPIRDLEAYGAAATRNQALNKLGHKTR